MCKKGEAKCSETAYDINIRTVCCVKWNTLSKLKLGRLTLPSGLDADLCKTEKMWDVKLWLAAGSPLDIGF